MNGKPLIAYAIEAARQAQYINRVVVSTDDVEIAAVAKRHGASVVMRPSDISGDMASSELALLHVLDHLEATESYKPLILAFLQCTSPLTLPRDIDGTIEKMVDEQADSALAVVPFHYFLWNHNEDGTAGGINHDKNMRLMRQQRKNQFLEAGAVYAMMVDGFHKHKHRFFGKTVLYQMPIDRCFEIDEWVDLKIAAVLMRERQDEMILSVLPDALEAVVFDFDGVFTDNRVRIDQNGIESVTCSRGDGMGIARLKNKDITLLVLSTEKNPVVEARCNKLGITFRQGLEDKKQSLIKWSEENKIDLANTIFVGNDINDAECLQTVGCSVVVNDAHPGVKSMAQIVLNAPGGHGAIRELADLIERKGKVA
ncbi:N-acylneuraminate cytidylyltransferase [Desulfosarcina cetonica]